MGELRMGGFPLDLQQHPLCCAPPPAPHLHTKLPQQWKGELAAPTPARNCRRWRWWWLCSSHGGNPTRGLREGGVWGALEDSGSHLDTLSEDR